MIDAVDYLGMAMELRHLRYFIALAERLNFTHAAAQVHVTQSTLSHQIRQLEEELGQALFQRTKRSVALTAAGELFLPRAVHALGELDIAIALLSPASPELTGQLRVGTTPTFDIHVIPRAITAFTARHPAVRLTVEEDTAASISRKVLQREFDIAISYHPGDEPKLSFEPLCNEELVLLVGAKHPLASRKHMRMVELHRREMILPSSRYTTRRMIEEAFAAAGATPIVRAESDSITAMLGTVRQSHLATIVSRHAVQGDSGFKIIALESPTPMRTPGLVRLKGAPVDPAQATLASIIREVTTAADFQPLQRNR